MNENSNSDPNQNTDNGKENVRHKSVTPGKVGEDNTEVEDKTSTKPDENHHGNDVQEGVKHNGETPLPEDMDNPRIENDKDKGKEIPVFDINESYTLCRDYHRDKARRLIITCIALLIVMSLYYAFLSWYYLFSLEDDKRWYVFVFPPLFGLFFLIPSFYSYRELKYHSKILEVNQNAVLSLNALYKYLDTFKEDRVSQLKEKYLETFVFNGNVFETEDKKDLGIEYLRKFINKVTQER